MIADLLIENASVVTSSGVEKLEIGIISGRISALAAAGDEVPARERLNASGMLVLPGLIDPHVHAGYGEPERETMASVSMAAAAGGMTTILDQPLSDPSTVTPERLLTKRADLENESVVDFALWGGLVPGHVDDLDGMMSEGAQAFKSFMCRCSNYPMTPDGTLLRGMRRVGDLGGLVAVHAENDTLIQDLVEEATRAGRRDIRAFLACHPVYSELEAVRRFIFLARLAPKCKAHIVHVSIPEAVLEVQDAKSRGIDITAETCPQYLGLSEDDLFAIGGVAKCDPPVRPRESVEQLWELVKSGAVDMIVSDHSPHTTTLRYRTGRSSRSARPAPRQQKPPGPTMPPAGSSPPASSTCTATPTSCTWGRTLLTRRSDRASPPSSWGRTAWGSRQSKTEISPCSPN